MIVLSKILFCLLQDGYKPFEKAPKSSDQGAGGSSCVLKPAQQRPSGDILVFSWLLESYILCFN